jgi:bifunctional non-homologous end joining protein LigD
MKPALAQSIDIGICTTADEVITALSRYITNDRYSGQQKLDGHRVLTEVVAGVVRPFNRAGDIRPAYLPQAIARCLQDTLTGHWILDGELIGDTYWVFDLLQALGVVTPDTPCAHRLHVLEEFFTVWQPPSCIQVVPRAVDEASKIALIRKVFDSGGEGIILRDTTRAYHPGRRTSDILKAKFISDADCVVIQTKHDGKDNLVLGIYNDAGRLVEVGHCTALSGNGMDARQGDVVTVQYLYMTDDHRLYQPTKPRIRHSNGRLAHTPDDKLATECKMDQFRFVNKDVIL